MNIQKRLPLLCLFLSGMGALILQEVWTRLSLLILGSTTLAVTIVLSAFMAGLALGSAWIAQKIYKLRRPFLVYFLVEAAAALVSFLVILLLKTPQATHDWPRWITFFALIGPTFLMGMTLPVVVLGIQASQSYQTKRIVGWAYGVNTLGGAIGALLGAFCFLPFLGVFQSGVLGCVSLGIAGLGGLWLKGVHVSKFKESDVKRKETLKISGSLLWILSLAFLTGAFGLGLELVWTRLLTLIFGPSVYAFGLVLFVYLLGIAIGAILLPRFSAVQSFSSRTLGVALLLGGGAVAWSMLIFGILPYVFLWLVEVFRPSLQALRLIEIILAVITIFPIAFVQGFLFPLLVKLVPQVMPMGKKVGWIYSANTIGSILGVILCGLVFIEQFGFLPILLGVFTIYIGLGTFYVGIRKNPSFAVISLLFVCVFIWKARTFWDQSVLASGVYKYAVGSALSGKKDTKIETGEILFYREGRSATVAVLKMKNDRVLSIDGKADASAYGDRSTQVLLGALPLSISRGTKNALVIGFASGVTAGISSLFPSTNVTSVEIEPAVIEASRFFEDVNHGPLRPPRHSIIVEDARHFLLTSKEKFDVITSEPSNPWMSGVAPLFTKEFFAMARTRLRPGGVMCQWLPIYGMSTALVASVFRTFAEEFPHVLVFESVEGFDLLFIGSNEKIFLNPQEIQRRWTNGKLREELHAIGIHTGLDLIAKFLMGTKSVKDFSKGALLNTDDNGYLEFEAPKALHLQTAKENDRLLSLVSDGVWPHMDPEFKTEPYRVALRKRFKKRGEPHLVPSK